MRVLIVALLAAISYAQTGVGANGACEVRLEDATAKCSNTRRIGGTVTTPNDCAQAVLNLNDGTMWFTYRQSKNRCEVPNDVSDGGQSACTGGNASNNNNYAIYQIVCPPPTKSPTAVPTMAPTGSPTASPVFDNYFMECLDDKQTGWACPTDYAGDTPSVEDGCCAWTREGIDGDQYAYKELRMDSKYGAILCTYPLLTGTADSVETYFEIDDPWRSTNIGDLEADSPCVYAESGQPVTKMNIDGIGDVTDYDTENTYGDHFCSPSSEVQMETSYTTDTGVASTINMVMNFFKDELTYSQFQSILSSYSVPYPANVVALEPYLDMDMCDIPDWPVCYRRAQGLLTDIVGKRKFTFGRHIWRNMRDLTMSDTDSNDNDVIDCKEDSIDGNCQAAYTETRYKHLRRKFKNLKKYYAERVYQP